MKSIVLMLSLFCLTAFEAKDPVFEVIESHKTAIGQSKLESLGMIKQTGVYSIAGKAQIKFVSYHYKGSMRIEYYYDELEPAVSVYTPDSSWKTTPWDLEKVVKLSDFEKSKFKEWALLTGVVANYKAFDLNPLLIESPYKSDNSIVVQLIKQDLITKINARLDPETHLLLSTELIEWKRGAEQKTPTIYSNYENVNGVMLPKLIEESFSSLMKMTYTIEKIESGLKFKKKLFKKP